MNLMLNGIEAMKDTGGELSIKSEPTEHEQLLISIKDTGAWGSRRNNLTRSSTHSLRRSPKGPAWCSRSAGQSSNRIAAACRRAPTQEKAPHFVLRCPGADSVLAFAWLNTLATTVIASIDTSGDGVTGSLPGLSQIGTVSTSFLKRAIFSS